MTDTASSGPLPALHDEPLNLRGLPADDWAKTPVSVQLAVRSLRDLVRAHRGQIRALQTLVRELQLRVGPTSRTASKPPAADPPAAPPPAPRPPRGRKAGGQAGHDGHQRPLVPPDQVHNPIELQPDDCPTWQPGLVTDRPAVGPIRRTQVWELPPMHPSMPE